MNLLDTEPHPLDRTIGHINHRSLWNSRWGMAATAEEYIGLLECGLRIPNDDKCKAIIWYLRVADLHQHTQGLTQQNDKQGVLTPLAHPYRGTTRRQLRRFIGNKAWEILARDYFATQELPADDDGPDKIRLFYLSGAFSHWSPVEYTESGYDLLEYLLAFFEIGRGNLPRTNHYPVLPGTVEGKDFVIRFAEWILNTGKYKPVEEKESCDLWKNRIYARGFKAVPQAVHLLKEMDALHKIRFLSPATAEAALPELWELVFRYGHYLTIEEAVAQGNTAAEIYILADLRLKYPKLD